MSFCQHCGKEIEDGAIACPQCGFAINYSKNEVIIVKSYTAIKVFMILGCVLNALLSYLIPLCWCIPMTVIAFKKLNKGERIGTGFKVCTLLFVSLIAGILLLCEKDI